MDDNPPTFEETYPKYEFSELVCLAIALGAWISGTRRRAKAMRTDATPAATTGKEAHAD